MRVLVFGRTGQVAQELTRRVPEGLTAVFLGRDRADLSDPVACAAAVRDAAANVVINVAAWTVVDKAEAEEAAAYVVNAEAPAAMARECALLGIPFLHVSTDYVFDGKGTQAFRPEDATAPQNAYGRTKRAGELAVVDSGARALVLRTSWIVSAHGTNFVKTILRLGATRSSLNVVADQVGGPTPAAAIADALFIAAKAMVGGQPGGIYHFAGAPDTSWADFSRVIMTSAGLACAVNDILTSDYPTPAKRPLNSRLDCYGFQRDFGVERPDWRLGLADILGELKGVA
ncbi:MAG: dTDP-4-dehydrorhamnose reductase [Rhodobacteraceae bacterium]|nr:dTDP-4-dehydrorhamnose reductase [Paracoccaceae bacterium]